MADWGIGQYDKRSGWLRYDHRIEVHCGSTLPDTSEELSIELIYRRLITAAWHCQEDCSKPRQVTHIHTHLFNGPFFRTTRWAGTRKVKPIWILLKQETVSGSGIGWAICKSAPRCRQISTPAPYHSVFYRPDALPATQPTASNHWRHTSLVCSDFCVSGVWPPGKLF